MERIDKGRIKQRFSAAVSNYDQQARAQQQIHQRLLSLLSYIDRQAFQRALEIGCGTGGLTKQLMSQLQVEHWELNDLCDMREHLQSVLPQPFHFHCGDAEQLPFPQQYDLIASASVVQWFEDKAGFIARCKVRLKKHGFLLFSTFTPNNLTQIKHLTGVGLTYPRLEDWQKWLVPEFEILALEHEEIVLHFDDPLAVLKHLKQTGVTATQQQGWTKGQLHAFCQQYQQHYRNAQHKVELTYTPMYVLARLT
ncbi:TPA: malonyl-ACP O-methyltransferase BioC [Pasteurella multocida]|nr:malonyl-ACP O-methyltransferase BioC [Pasteurella multocida]HED4398868.1 malonyl-ACP O-methyltransferase BioC [Pasteurella multocida]